MKSMREFRGAALSPINEEKPRSPNVLSLELPALDLPHKNPKRYKTYNYIFIDDADDVDRQHKVKKIRKKENEVLDELPQTEETTAGIYIPSHLQSSPRTRPLVGQPVTEDPKLNRLIKRYISDSAVKEHIGHGQVEGACPCCTERNAQNLYHRQKQSKDDRDMQHDQLVEQTLGRQPVQGSGLPPVPGFNTSVPFTDDGLGVLQSQVHGYPTYYNPVESGAGGYQHTANRPTLPLSSVPVYPTDVYPLDNHNLRDDVYKSSAAYEVAMDKLKHVSGSFRF